MATAKVSGTGFGEDENGAETQGRKGVVVPKWERADVAL